ncbi:glycosyltransferase [Myxosarcina sp. GI1]|uniref:glycosyltransferase n=1 Tax=Myxosarcina sp. GI1 TaxID=1541065 RepID=UPI00056459C3|nr:glycosyltransferase [Myxosarcina sp. GI1]
MKPKVWHLIGDKRAGGSNHLVKQLIASPLQKQFDFSMLRLEAAKVELKTSKPDVIIFHYPCAWKYLSALWLLKRHSKIYICDHHYCQGFETEQVSSKLRFRTMLRLAYGLADGVISISQAQREWMVSNWLVCSKKVRIISPATKIAKVLKIPDRHPSQPLKLGAYGRFAPQKGFDILLQAFAALPPEKFQLCLAGYGQDEKLIKDLAKDLPHVRLLGAIDNIASFLANSDAIVIPSRWEPWGLVCLEAKAAGKPVIASDIDGLSEQMRDCGLLVPPNDIEQLKNAIASLPQQNLAVWGKAGRTSVTDVWQEFLRNWEVFLGDVTK